MDTKYFDSLLEPVFIINTEKEILYCNETAALMTDQSARKLVRSKAKLTDIFDFATRIEALDNLAGLDDASPYQEVAFQNKSNKAGRAQITVQKFDLDGQSAYLMYFRDVTLEETLQRKYRAELEKTEAYARDLEKMVDQRTAEVKRLNVLLKALLDSLSQGFFAFDDKGNCLEVYSKACESILNCQPHGKNVTEVLQLPQAQHDGFKKWMLTAFSEMLPFEDLAPLAPQSLITQDQKHIKLEYYPLRGNENNIEALVVVATDISELLSAQHQAEKDAAKVQMILSLIKNRQQTDRFLSEIEHLVHEVPLDLTSQASCNIDRLFRNLHTIKGGAATYSIKNVVDLCHHAEAYLQEYKMHKSEEHWNKLVSVASQIPVEYNAFLQENETILGDKRRRSQKWYDIPESKLKDFSNKLESKDKNLHQEFNEYFIYESLKEKFSSFNEVLQNMAYLLGKKINSLNVPEHDIAFPEETFGPLMSTWIHFFRNVIDHGIEAPEQRLASGKSEFGNIFIDYKLTSTHLHIEIRDDGAGISADKLRNKLTEKGLSVDHESDEEIIQHVFDSQVSTRDEVSEISGRGIGMDAIKAAVQDLNGKAWVESKAQQGTCLKVEIPWKQNTLKTSKAA